MSAFAESGNSPELLTLNFLGRRSYLQGTTLFNALERRLKAAEGIHLQCRKVISTDRVEVQSGVGALPNPASWHAWLTWREVDGPHWIGIHPVEPSPEPPRETYDESLLTRLAVISENEITLSEPSPFSFVSTVVSLHKHLLLTQHPPEREGQWLFTGLKLGSIPNPWLPLRLKINQLLSGIAARTAIFVGDQQVGDVEFVWHPKSLHAPAAAPSV